MRASLDRRQFLNRGLFAGAGIVALGAGGSSLLAACGSSSAKSSPSASGGATDFGALKYQLSWIKNTEFAGQYFADKNGYYKKEGFSSVQLLAGGPTVAQDAVVAAGKTLVAISSPDIAAPAVLKGSNTIIVAALFQKNPFCMMSLASNPLKDPKSMIGKKIGIQAANTSVFNSFLKANDLSPSQMTIVPVQFDPTPLANKQVDGWFSFVTNEPNLLKEKGVDTTTFLLNDYNYPLVSQVYVVKRDSLDSKRDAIKALLKADIMGWHDALKDARGGAALAVNTYGKGQGLTIDEQTLESEAQNKLILDDRTKTDGIMTMTDAMIEENIKSLALGGTTIKAEQLFDMSVINEVYKENPNLKAFSA
jgi:ABC-type nitrate/sulfonate/bicarbonate transport system substrate-binding protein